MSESVRFVYCDIGGVMVNFNRSLVGLADKLGVDRNKFIEAWRPWDNKACRGDIQPSDMWRNVLQDINYSGESQDLTMLWLNGFEKNVKIHKLISQLARTTAVGILSNLYPGFYEKMYRRGLIPNLDYAARVISCEVHLVKPEPEIFKVAEAMSSVSPQEILLVDDLPQNIEQAIIRGWQGILFDGTNIEKVHL